MGIDHGLGGRDGVKSKQKREKKAKKNKVIAMRALTGGRKKEVIFDENARTEWLGGFHKRKQERRKYGLAMEVLKKNKTHKEMVKEQRNVFNEERDKKMNIKKNSKNPIPGHDDDDDEEEETVDPQLKYTESLAPKKNQEVSVFEDASTLSMFGSTVSVVVDTSLGEEEGEGEESDEEDNRSMRSTMSMSKRNAPRELSKFEKAMKIAKEQMSKKKKKHKDNSVQGKASSLAMKNKVQASKMLSKVLRKPMNGKHSGGRKRK